MLTKKQIRHFCYLLVISVLLMGVCPTGKGADSFFVNPGYVSSQQDSLESAQIPARGFLKSTVTANAGDISYSRESLPEYETFLTPITSLRRISLRIGNRGFLMLYPPYDAFAYSCEYFTDYSQYFFAEIVSNTVIIRYIHHQDGSKA